MDRRLPHGVRAQRHRLLADETRLAIVEALGEGARQIPELARLLDIHPTTVRAHLEKLLAAGVLEEEAGLPAGRGRPSKRYRLRHPLIAGEPEVRLVVNGLVSLLRRAYGEQAVEAATEEGARRGREFVRSFRHPSLEQTMREVTGTLERLSFAPSPPVRKDGGLVTELHHCPFRVDPDDPDGPLVCAFHEGLVRGMAEVASGETVRVRVTPFVAPGVCRVELSEHATPAPAPARRRARAADSAEPPSPAAPEGNGQAPAAKRPRRRRPTPG